MSRLNDFFDAYAEQSLTGRDQDELCAWLAKSDANVDEFVRMSFLHSQLFAVAARRTLHTDVMDGSERMDSSIDRLCEVVARDNRRVDRRTRLTVVLALAASIALAVTAATWQFSRPRAVAQLTQVSADAKWDGAGPKAVGSLVNEGEQLRLTRGKALATLVSGAKIVIEAPAELRLTGEKSLWLKSGRLGAAIPPEATGLSIETPLGQFLDLGTEFTLDVAPNKCKLYVFSGLVEVRPASSAPANRPFQVPQSRAVSYDAASGKVVRIELSQEHRLSL